MVEFSRGFSTLVITQIFCVWRFLPFALKGLWKLAGGEGFAAPPEQRDIWFPALKGRQPRVSSVALSGLGGLLLLLPGVPKTPPPANFRCASGAKRKDLDNDKRKTKELTQRREEATAIR